MSPSQKELLLNAKVNFVEYNAIEIAAVDFDIDPVFKNYIFTSQNAVARFLEKTKQLPSPEGDKAGVRVFCVGEKTKSLLKANGFEVVENAENASELAEIVVKKYKNEPFLFFSGNLRRNELPKEFKKNNIRYEEVTVYHTVFKRRKFDRTFDGILFFSPSAIQSFVIENELKNMYAFCIGETTAEEAKKYTDKISIANKPTMENVLVQAIKQLAFRT